MEQRLQAQMLYFYCIYFCNYLEFTGNEATFLLVQFSNFKNSGFKKNVHGNSQRWEKSQAAGS